MRLTERLPNGVVKRSDVMGDNVMLRLAAYEDTGLMPDEIAAKLAELEAYKQAEAGGVLVRVPDCDTCKHKDKPADADPCIDCQAVGWGRSSWMYDSAEAAQDEDKEYKK